MVADIEAAFSEERPAERSIATPVLGCHCGKIAANRALENMNLHDDSHKAFCADGRWYDLTAQWAANAA
jgi:hypothetical protein